MLLSQLLTKQVLSLPSATELGSVRGMLTLNGRALALCLQSSTWYSPAKALPLGALRLLGTGALLAQENALTAIESSAELSAAAAGTPYLGLNPLGYAILSPNGTPLGEAKDIAIEPDGSMLALTQEGASLPVQAIGHLFIIASAQTPAAPTEQAAPLTSAPVHNAALPLTTAEAPPLDAVAQGTLQQPPRAIPLPPIRPAKP